MNLIHKFTIAKRFNKLDLLSYFSLDIEPIDKLKEYGVIHKEIYPYTFNSLEEFILKVLKTLRRENNKLKKYEDTLITKNRQLELFNNQKNK